MGKSNLLEFPSQAPESADKAGPNLELRQRRAVALVPTVRRVDGGFRVGSSCRDINYLVTRPSGRLVCTCRDFQRHEDEPGFQCKHIIAVDMAGRENRIPEPRGGAPPAAPVSASPSSENTSFPRYWPGEDRVRIRLIKNTKGYSWDILVAERDPEAALSTLRSLEQKVKQTFGEMAGEQLDLDLG